MDTPKRPQKLWEGQLVDIDDDAFEAWIANGCPTEIKSIEEPIDDAEQPT